MISIGSTGGVMIMNNLVSEFKTADAEKQKLQDKYIGMMKGNEELEK